MLIRKLGQLPVERILLALNVAAMAAAAGLAMTTPKTLPRPGVARDVAAISISELQQP